MIRNYLFTRPFSTQLKVCLLNTFNDLSSPSLHGLNGNNFVRNFQTSSPLFRTVVARPKASKKKTNPITFEELLPPHFISVRKGFNSFNTSNLLGEIRSGETAIEDMFIRKFIEGTWHRLLIGKLIIKRRANQIILSGLFHQSLAPSKFYFLQGYTEEILSYILKCPTKMEILTTNDRRALVVTYM
ncbi:28S ribosomal protein S24, mitochondrial-like [Panonychus citri]|uniref:28S ribosomal protein S24, mitochondrial-like n=1 Tax=Panonychus citri TaxID=50023 RepID=UPI002307722E|nr:28S ribosomal protein S24, mitochondrial-like [Panonychus citri]